MLSPVVGSVSYFASSFLVLYLSEIFSVQVGDDRICAFCGESGKDACQELFLVIRKSGKLFQVSTQCPQAPQPGWSWSRANDGMAKHPSRNVPVLCKLCIRPAQYNNTLYHPAIWRYNLDAHIRCKHPDHATPSHPCGEFELPKELWETMVITETEQDGLNIPQSIRFPSSFDRID